jgi:predicted Zn-dependent protease
VDRPGRVRQIAGVAASLAIVALATRAFVRSTDWLDARTFYERTAAAGGTSCRVGANLGQIYCSAGEYGKAEAILRRVLKIDPDYTIARNSLADAVVHQGREDEARQILAEAANDAHEAKKDYPRTWVAALNYARTLSGKGDVATALSILDNARAEYPGTWELISSESEMLRSQNRLNDAIRLLGNFAENNWWHYGVWMALGRVLAERQDIDLAEETLRHASWLDVRSTDALNLIAVMKVQRNNLGEAYRAQRQAIGRQPDQPRQYLLLSNILEKMGRNDEARTARAEVSRLRTLASAVSVAK